MIDKLLNFLEDTSVRDVFNKASPSAYCVLVIIYPNSVDKITSQLSFAYGSDTST